MAYTIPYGLHWWALHTRAQHERLVASQLAGKRLEFFLPTYRASGRSRRRERPLFPGYLFVRAELTLPVRIAILECRGVVELLGSPSGPISVPGEQIVSVQRLVGSSSELELLRHLLPGVRVRVESGPLAGVIGVVVRAPDERMRIICNVDILGRAVATELAADAVTIVLGGSDSPRQLQ